MANKEHEERLRQNVESWNEWRKQHPRIKPDLRSMEWKGAYLRKINLSGAILSGAKLHRARLSKANLVGADLSGADLRAAYFRQADLTGANLQNANLKYTVMVATKIDHADISNCKVYGVAAWDVTGTPRDQTNLIITREAENPITVDRLEVAQFVHLLLKNEKIRDVIDTIGKTGVLILGRFTEKRKVVLDAIRNKLRELKFVPMMFDFERPTERDFTETIKTLAGLSRFIIADITKPRSSPLELQAIVPDYMVPLVPIVHKGEKSFAMFRDLKQKYSAWVLDPLRYESVEMLVQKLEEAVVRPALKMGQELLRKKAEPMGTRDVDDY